MTEKQRSDAGLPYFPGDEELRALRARCKQLCYAFNTTEHQQREERINLLRQLLGSTNGRFLIEPSFWCDYGYNIHIGEGSFVNFDCVFLDLAPIRIGRNTLIGPKVQLLTPHHPLDPDLRATGREAGKPITIGDNCWLGGGVIVCPGVRIGNGAIIGAGSVVTRDIPADSVAVGNPARVTRTLSHT